MKNVNISKERLLYLRKAKIKTVSVHVYRVGLLILLLSVWEIFAKVGIIDPFISSSPSKIIKTVVRLFSEDDLSYHMGITLYETLLGFTIAVFGGYAVAVLLWWSDTLKRVLEPYIVVLNCLPKIALGPIIIVWCGSGRKAIIFMTVLVSIVVATITMLGGFSETDKNKTLLLRSMGASKMQILCKLVIPESLPTLISMLKISIGMAWIGSIMGEYLVSRAGLGYLIVYGGQVFKLDLVMASTFVLCVLASLLYGAVALLEKKIVRY